MNEIKVLIVGENPLARMGLAGMLANRAECTVIGQASPEQMELIDTLKPEVLVWDTGWEPGLERLTEAAHLPIVALLSEAADAHDTWVAGAVGLLPQRASADQLAAAIVAVGAKLTVIDPSLTAALLPRERPTETPPQHDLTPRESEVLHLMAQGLANKIIALQLGISEHTVKFHVNAIMTKLGAQSRTEAVVRATRQGLIML